MTSAILLVVFNALFMGLTMFWGAWYSLSGRKEDFKATLMPIILAGPRFLVVIASIIVGMKVFNWNADVATTFVALLMSLWVLLVTGEIMYVQTYLRKRYENQKASS